MKFLTSATIFKGHTISAHVDLLILNKLIISQHQIINLVLWRALVIFWVKANTDGSLIGSSSACGATFRKHLAKKLDGFAKNLPFTLVLHAKLISIILEIEISVSRGWVNIWIEIDSQVSIRTFKKSKIG